MYPKQVVNNYPTPCPQDVILTITTNIIIIIIIMITITIIMTIIMTIIIITIVIILITAIIIIIISITITIIIITYLAVARLVRLTLICSINSSHPAQSCNLHALANETACCSISPPHGIDAREASLRRSLLRYEAGSIELWSKCCHVHSFLHSFLPSFLQSFIPSFSHMLTSDYAEPNSSAYE